MNSYSDVLLRIKRGFLVIGLTGYTGSGCSTVMKTLERTEKLSFPGLSSLKFDVDPKVHSKLERNWNEMDWSKFVSIEVSKVIFMFVIHKAVNSDSRSELLDKVSEIISPYEKDFNALHLLMGKDSNINDIENAKILVNAYRKSKRYFGAFKNKCSNSLDDFIEIMQDLGDEIRRYGQIRGEDNCAHCPDNMLVLPEAIRRIIKAFRVANGNSRFVVDAFRNPYEVEYFKRRYSEFYLVAVQRSTDDVRKALRNLSGDAIEKIKQRELGENKKSSENYEWITSQNIEECFQKADMFIDNIYDQSQTYPHLRYQLLRFIILSNLPGIIPPNSDERSMQMAMTAKQNSGCLSRHVGAVVVGKSGLVIGFGWNDPPFGQVPCSLRTGNDLLRDMDTEKFSEFERSDVFIGHISKSENKNFPFCFKDELKSINGKSVNEFTRALHAEENAMLQALSNAGKEGLEGSTIFTTDSPCTLCSKKAYHLGVKRIVYIEEYPGIASSQTLFTGERKVSLEQFQGITGSAYFRLFSSLMNEKDFLKIM
jgi:dCMP deaminase